LKTLREAVNLAKNDGNDATDWKKDQAKANLLIF
jgi:hypothetical protein